LFESFYFLDEIACNGFIVLKEMKTNFYIVILFILHIYAEHDEDEHTEVDSCEDKRDGLYAMRDYSKYMNCTNKNRTILLCDQGLIYKADIRRCISISNVSKENFCHSRGNGDYMSPWENCQKYIHCIFGWADILECEQGFYYDPETDECHQIVNGSCPYSSANVTTTPTDFNQSATDLIFPEQLRKELMVGSVRLIDVREDYELKIEGRIAQSIHIPLGTVEHALEMNDKLFKDVYHVDKPLKEDCNLVFHCKTGVRSYRALQISKTLGYKCPKSLTGGFNAWKEMLT